MSTKSPQLRTVPDQNETFEGHRRRFAERSSLRQKAMAAFGRLGTERLMGREVDQREAEILGKRRVVALAVTVALGFGAYKAAGPIMKDIAGETGATYRDRIERCAEILTGTDIPIVEGNGGPTLLVVPENYAEVAACERMNGDVEGARNLMTSDRAPTELTPAE